MVKSIKIDNDRLLLPGPKDEHGCTQFTLHSKSKKITKQVLYYADKNGKYSMDRSSIKNCI